jgi:hypothetical protein
LGAKEKNMFFVTSLFKGITINKKNRLAHVFLFSPETRIFKWLGYKKSVQIKEALISNLKYVS